MDSKKIQFVIIGIIATIVALYLGISAATAQFETIAWVIGILVFITCLSLGHKIWLLIPFMIALDMRLMIPGNPDTRLIGQFLVIGFCIPLFLMRKLSFRLAWGELEFWILILTLFVVQVYLRNPVGVNVFGGATVGGKAYSIYLICLVSGLLLGGLTVPASELKWVFRLSIMGGLMNLVLTTFGTVVPSIGVYLGVAEVHSVRDTSSDAGNIGDASRIGYLGSLGSNLALWISACISPLRACLHPLWGGLVLIAVVASLMSGYRSFNMLLGMTFIVGVAYRSGLSGLNLSIFGAICGVAMLAAINLVAPLPPNIQRALTFLPGTWEDRYRRDAESSSEWRFEIWREVLTSPRWIENKWLGDGLGFKASELAAQQNMQLGNRASISGFDVHRDAILKSGDYHSGPVQTIRTIGYVGLVFLLIALVRLAVHAHRQIQRCRNTEWFPLALLVGIPLISFPFFFVFVFGGFTTGFTSLFMGYGMVRILEKNLPLPAYVLRKRRP